MTVGPRRRNILLDHTPRGDDGMTLVDSLKRHTTGDVEPVTEPAS
jgi:hypothetical protein